MNSPFALDAWLALRRAEVNALLEARLPALPLAEDPGRLTESARYSLLAPGKRLRPLLALAAAEALGAPLSEPIRLAAAAVELVHCYSLIHDDLPCMDDDDFRRGKPTNHKVFGEAIAVLAGDGLLTLAFEWLADAAVMTEKTTSTGLAGFVRASAALARGAGMCGMVRGQARDLAEPPPATLALLEQLHREKTGGLFTAALEIGALTAGASTPQVAALSRFGDCFGIAFQHADDLSDSDHANFSGEARARGTLLAQQATAALKIFGPAALPLRALAATLAAPQP